MQRCAEASKVTDADIRRVGGRNRFGTAALLLPDTIDTIYLATGETFTAAPTAANAGGAILLTGRDHLPAETADALAALAPINVIVLGGEAAISTAVIDAVTDITGHY